MKGTRIGAYLFVLGLLIAPVWLAQPRDARAGDERIEISMTGPTPIESFLDTVRDSTGYPLVWDPNSRAIQGKQIAGALHLVGTADEVLSAVRSALTFYELVIIPVGPQPNELLLVVDVRQTSAILKLKPLYVELAPSNLARYAGMDGLFVTTTIHVEHMADLRDARNALNRIVTGQNIGNVTEVPSARSFVVTDFAPNVVSIYRLIRQMDEAARTDAEHPTRPKPVFEMMQLAHANAVELAPMLTAQFGTIARPGPAAQGTAPAAPGDDTDVLRIHADPRTNALLVSGAAEDVSAVRTAVKGLDVSAGETNTYVHIVALQHAPASRVADALQILVGSSRSGLFDPRPSIVPHVDTNSLLIECSPRVFEVLKEVIEKLDVEPPK